MTQVAKSILVWCLLCGATYNIAVAQVSFCAVGDVLLDRNVRNSIEKEGIYYPFEKIKHIIRQNDLALFNIECPIADAADGYKVNKRYSFRAEPEYIDGLKYAGFNIASVANNHTMDYGKSGFLKTIELLNRDSIFTIGGGQNQDEAFQPLLLEKNDETFALFGALEFLLEGTTFNEDRPYPAYGQIDKLCRIIEAYNPFIDNIIVSFHWGIENSTIPTSRQIEYAHKLINAGADLVLGHHPHVLQSIETYHDKLIIYSLGNFIFDNSRENQKQSVIFQCKFKDGCILNPELIPVYIKNNSPEVASSKIRAEIFESLSKNSTPFNTSLTLNDSVIKIKSNQMNTIKELKIKNIHFNIHFDLYLNRIVVHNDKDEETEYVLPDVNLVFKDACIWNNANSIYIYAIMQNLKNNKSMIAIFPFSIDSYEFLQPSIDSHQNLDLWKIEIFDVDNDNNPELIVGIKKTTKYDKAEENRIFVFNIDKDYIYPKWLGSKLGNTIVDFKIDRLAKKIVVIEESINSNKKMVVAYDWNGFGFDSDEILFEIAELKSLKFQFHLPDYKFNHIN